MKKIHIPSSGVEERLIRETKPQYAERGYEGRHGETAGAPKEISLRQAYDIVVALYRDVLKELEKY